MPRVRPYAASNPVVGVRWAALLALIVLVWATVTAARAAERCGGPGARVLAQSAPGRIAFAGRRRTLILSSTCGPIGAAVRRASPAARVFLVVEDLRASSQPGAIFDISLAPPDRRGKRREPMLGALNFFNAHPASAGEGRRASYDVTAALKALVRRQRLSTGVALAIEPLSAPDRRSDASAGAIRLVLQER